MAVVVGTAVDMVVVIENSTEITMRLVTVSLRLLATVLLRVDLQEASLLQVLLARPIRTLPVSFLLPHSAWMYTNVSQTVDTKPTSRCGTKLWLLSKLKVEVTLPSHPEPLELPVMTKSLTLQLLDMLFVDLRTHRVGFA